MSQQKPDTQILQKELLETKRYLAEVVDEVLYAENELKAKEEENRVLLSDLRQSIELNTELERQLTTRDSELQNAREQIILLEEKLSSEYHQRDKMSAISAEEQVKLVSLQKSVAALDLEKQQLANERKNLEEQIEHLNQENDTLREQTQELISTLDSTQKSFNKMKQDRMFDVTSDKINESQTISMQKVIADLEQENKKLKMELKKIQVDLNNTGGIKYEELKYENDLLSKQLSAERMQTARLQEKLKSTTSALMSNSQTESGTDIQHLPPRYEGPLLVSPKARFSNKIHKSPRSSPPTPKSPNVLSSSQRNTSTTLNFQNKIISEEAHESTQFQSLRMQKDQLESEVDRIKHINSDLSKQLRDLSHLLREKDFDLTRIRKELEKVHSQFTHDKDSNPRLNHSNLPINDEQISLLNVNIENLKEQNKILREENKYLEQTISQLKEQVETQQEDKNKAIEKEDRIEALMKENSHIAEQLVHERNHNTQLAKEIALLTSRLSQYERQVSSLEERFFKERQSLSNSSQESQQKIINLQNELIGKEGLITKLKKQIDEYERQTTDSLNLSSKLERERSIMNQTLEDVKTENSLLRSDKMEYQREISQLKSEIEILRQQLEREKEHNVEAAETHKRELQSVQENKSILMKELEALKGQILEYRQLINPLKDLKVENESQKSLIDKYNEAVSKLESNIMETSKREKILEENNRKLQLDITKLTEEIRSMKQFSESLRIQHDHDQEQMRSRAQKLVETISRLENENEELSRQNNVLSMRILQQDHEINGFAESKELIDSNLTHFKERLKALEEDYAAKESQHQQMLSQQRNELEDIIDEERRENAKVILSLREEVDRLVMENQKIRRQVHIDVEQELHVMRNRIHQNNETITEIRKDILFTKSGLNQLQKGLHAMLNALTLQEEKVLKPLRQANGGPFGDKKRLASAYVNRITQKMGELATDMDSKSQLLDARLQLRISSEFNKKLTSRIEETEMKLEKADRSIQELQSRLTSTENQYVEAESIRRDLEYQLKQK